MKQPTFFEGVAVAVGASLVGSVVYAALTTVFASDSVLRLLIAGIGLAYIVYLLARSRTRVGRITAVGAWSVLALVAWFMAPPMVLYVLLHLSAIWLIRSLYFHASVLSALVDLGLSGLSLAAAVWAAGQSGSLLLSIWSFFLVQALFVAIPHDLRRGARQRRPEYDGEDRFQHAHQVAEAAVRRLSSMR